MQDRDDVKKFRFGALVSGRFRSGGTRRPSRVSLRQKLFWLGALVLIVVIIVLLLASSNEKSSRTEVYKKVSGAAGLQAIITYDVQCDKKPCDKKPAFDFNVYIFAENGQQVNVVRPDRDGKVNLALPEGDYIMLIGKQFGKHKQFPQEPLHLKNGKLLELKLHY